MKLRKQLTKLTLDMDAAKTRFLFSFIIHIIWFNQKSNWSRFVRWDRSSPIKKNTFIIFYHHDTHYYVIISHYTSVSRYDWPFGITGYWNAYVTCLMGVAYKNLSVKSDFSQMHPSRSGFHYERGAFHLDWSDWLDFWLGQSLAWPFCPACCHDCLHFASVVCE